MSDRLAEPTRFGAIVIASYGPLGPRVYWQRGPSSRSGWTAEDGAYVPSFDLLHNPVIVFEGVEQ